MDKDEEEQHYGVCPAEIFACFSGFGWLGLCLPRENSPARIDDYRQHSTSPLLLLVVAVLFFCFDAL